MADANGREGVFEISSWARWVRELRLSNEVKKKAGRGGTEGRVTGKKGTARRRYRLGFC